MKKILVAVDGSASAERVLATAVELARGSAGRLILLRAVSVPTELPLEALAIAPVDVPQLLLERAKTDLARLAQLVPPDVLDSFRAEVGTPWRTVVEAAARDRVDLIVIGSHGYSGLDRLLGTTAAKIVDHAACSVLVARPTP